MMILKQVVSEIKTCAVYSTQKQPHKLRYIVGIIISENGSVTPPEHITLLEENGYHFATFPAIDHAVQTRFPFKSTISIIVAIMKVYPAIREYIEYRSLCARPFLEVYDNEKSEIIFVGPLARQDDFYVPEVQQEEDEDNRDEDYDDDRTENSSRSWDESASFVRGHEINDSECSESVGGDDSSSFARPLPPPPVNPNASLDSSLPPQPQAPVMPDYDMNDSECSESLEDDNSSPPTLLPQPPVPQHTASYSDVPSESLLFSQPPHVAQAEAINTAEPFVRTPVVAAPVSDAAPVADAPVPVPDLELPGAAAPLPSETAPVVDVGESVESASVGGTESDANTASSFEEIDEKEAASIPDMEAINGSRGSSLRKDEDEGER
ncbi:proline-rich protein 12-like isoform X3 [Macrobrachium rosenbergii]|uniref:proline-rich protein 12-like isoform X3 n=1 Tax=Macrobrachium rosenbergii TaxID=79674 RepID=UPI0034D513E5